MKTENVEHLKEMSVEMLKFYKVHTVCLYLRITYHAKSRGIVRW